MLETLSALKPYLSGALSTANTPDAWSSLSALSQLIRAVVRLVKKIFKTHIPLSGATSHHTYFCVYLYLGTPTWVSYTPAE